MTDPTEVDLAAKLQVAAQEPTDHHFWFGAITSFAYVAALSVYSWHEWPHMRAMKPDEFATFLSGAFAPLAFLWLVLGFRQQGDELQNSARALYLQSEELRHSVEQQRQLVEVSREQLDAERRQREELERIDDIRAQPQIALSFDVITTAITSATLRFTYDTSGSAATDISITFNGKGISRDRILTPGFGRSLNVELGRKTDYPDGHIEFHYTDARGNLRSQCFRVIFACSEGEAGWPRVMSVVKCDSAPHMWSDHQS